MVRLFEWSTNSLSKFCFESEFESLVKVVKCEQGFHLNFLITESCVMADEKGLLLQKQLP